MGRPPRFGDSAGGFRISFLQRLQRRFNTARPGSVLILVVALLVLLALMGTAYISTSHVDRYSSQQNSFNTEVDLLLQAVVNIEQSKILTAPGAPTNTPTLPTDATIWTSPTDSTWFGPRVPVALPTNGSPGWSSITAPPLGGSFESPVLGTQYSTLTDLVPTSISVTSSTGSTTTYPAFGTYLAASASGDGIADAGLWRLPIGQVNGITYYAAVRVLDNGSAINASIAYQPNSPTASLPGDFFPTNIDLNGLLHSGSVSASQQMAALNAYRWGPGNSGASLTPIYDQASAIGVTPVPMSYTFVSPFEAMWSQLGRRLDNPGINTPGTGSPATPIYYQALPIGESMTLAHRFCLVNPAASPSILEQDLAPSVLYNSSGLIRTSPYSPDQAAQWFSDNFIYEAGGNLRPLMVARNQVSNISASRFTSRPNSLTPANNTWDPTLTYSFGDWVTGLDGCTYVCIQDNTSALQPPTPYSSMVTWENWAQEPWMDYPVKTSVNTGTFGQLWLGYWSAMSGSGGPGQPDPASATAMFRNPIRGAVAVSSAASSNNNIASSGNTVTISPSGGDDTGNIQSAINQSNPGDTILFSAGNYTVTSQINFLSNRIYTGGGAVSGIAALTPPQTLRLRSALAAINSQQLRGTSSQIISRAVGIGGAIASPTSGAGGAVITEADGLGVFSFSNTTNTEFYGFSLSGIQIQCFTSSSSNIHNNSFTNVPTEAINISGNSNSQYNNNTFTQITSGGGIYGYPGNNDTYDNNSFDYVFEPIHLVSGCNTVDVSGNVINHATRNGIELQDAMTNVTVNNNYMINWLPHITNNNDTHIGISCATMFGSNITISGNTLIQNGPTENMDTDNYDKAAIEIMANSGITISNNYGWNWGLLEENGSGPNGYTSTDNTEVGGILVGYDGVPPSTYKMGSPNSTGDRLYGLNDPDAPPWPAMPTNSSFSSSTTQPTTTPASITYRVMLYGTGQQPYLTEVYANNDQSTANNGQTGNAGFIALSLYNPYNQTISLRNWQFVTVNRQNGVGQLAINSIAGAPTDLSTVLASGLAPYQRVVFASSANMPTGITVDQGAGGSPIVIPQLTAAFNNELMLVRPRQADGTLTAMTAVAGSTSYDPNDVYNEATNVSDMVPVDCYDFTGLPAAPSQDDADSTQWHYIRPSDQATHNWYFVYPYTYNRDPTQNPSPNYPTSSNPNEPYPRPRLFATLVSSGAAPSTPNPLGYPDTAPADSYFANLFQSTNGGLPIQINNTDFGGPKENANQFPYAAFARNGDILQTTFIGAYRIDIVTVNTDGTTSTKTVEYNPVTMDSAFADDLDNNDNQAENVGRFCPLSPADCNGEYNDFDSAGNPSAYHFAMRLFDFMTANGPADDYMQNVGAENAPVRYPIANVKPSHANAYPTQFPGTTEDNAPTDGLININTAPWRVLATLPMANNAADNQTLAKAIVNYRDVNRGDGTPHGAFKSILELNGVVDSNGRYVFRNTLASTALNAFNPKGSDQGPTDGDLAPFLPNANDYVPGDFEKQFLAFNRLSNLVTVRSDSFTAYVLVQGWRNVGTAAPELVVQRRAAFIADRSASTPSNLTLNVTNIPSNN
jgi:hypothetical protein